MKDIIIWGLALFGLWIVATVIAFALVVASGADPSCTCLGDYDDDNDRTCARCHE